MGKKIGPREKESFFSDPLLLTLSLVLALLPIVMFPFEADVYALPKITFLYISCLFMLFLYYFRAVRTEKFIVYRSILDLPIVLILIYAAVSLFFSQEPFLGLIGRYDRYEGLPALLCYAVIYFISVQTLRSENALERLLKIMTLGLIPIVIYGIAQSAGFDFPNAARFGLRAHASIGNPILLGAYLVIMLPLLFSLSKNNRESGWRLLFWLLIPAMFTNLVLAESRGAWLGLAISMLAVFVMRRPPGLALLKNRRRSVAKVKDYKSKDRVVVIGIAVVAIIVILSAPFGLSSHYAQRFFSTFAFSESAANARIETWRASLHMIHDRPLLGFGLGQAEDWYPAYKTAKHIEVAPKSLVDRPHNDFLQIATDLGIPGLFLCLWILLLGLIAFLKGRLSSSYATGLFAAISGYFAQAQTGMPAVFIMPIAWSLLGASVSLAHPGKGIEVKLPRWIKTKVAVYAVAAPLVALATFAFIPIIADNHIYNGRQVARDSLSQAFSEFEAAIRLYPYQPAYPKAAAGFYLDYAIYEQNKIFAQRAALIAEQGLRYNRRDFDLAYYAGEANLLSYRLTEDDMVLQRAQRHFMTAEALWPSMPIVKSRLLEIAVIRGETRRAVLKAEEIIKLGGQDPQAYYFLAMEAQKHGEHGKLEHYMKKARELDPRSSQKIQGQ